jgi:hypothetical protein
LFKWNRIIDKIKGDALMKFGIRMPSLKGIISASLASKDRLSIEQD